MIAVIFEVHPREGHAERYFELAAQLRAELEQIEGFISVERFESLTRPGHYLSLSFWRDEDAVRRWRCQGRRRSAQREAGASSPFGWRRRCRCRARSANGPDGQATSLAER